MIGSASDPDHSSEPVSTTKLHDGRAAALEPKETIGRRAASTCSAAFRCASPRRYHVLRGDFIGHAFLVWFETLPLRVRCRTRRIRA